MGGRIDQGERITMREAMDRIRALIDRVDPRCLYCGERIESLVKVGETVWAEPCNHDQYRGVLPKAWK